MKQPVAVIHAAFGDTPHTVALVDVPEFPSLSETKCWLEYAVIVGLTT